MKIEKISAIKFQENTYAVYDDEKTAFLLDPGAEGENILTYIEKNELNLKYIVLTHGHGDHIASIPFLKEKFPDIKIIAHFDEQDLLIDSDKNLSKMLGMGDLSLDADIYVTEEDKFQIGQMNLEFLHTPGHTVGSMCVIMEDTMFTGDTLFHGSIGRTDLPTSSRAQMEDTMKKLYALEKDYILYPGHDSKTTLFNEKKYNMYLNGNYKKYM